MHKGNKNQSLPPHKQLLICRSELHWVRDFKILVLEVSAVQNSYNMTSSVSGRLNVLNPSKSLLRLLIMISHWLENFKIPPCLLYGGCNPTCNTYFSTLVLNDRLNSLMTYKPLLQKGISIYFNSCNVSHHSQWP